MRISVIDKIIRGLVLVRVKVRVTWLFQDLSYNQVWFDVDIRVWIIVEKLVRVIVRRGLQSTQGQRS